MSHQLCRSALLAAALLVTSPANAELVTEATFGSGYQGNLFSDSTSIRDAHASAGIRLRYYPSASAQVTTSVEYHAYAQHRDLSNLSGAATVTFVPTAETSVIRLALSGLVSFRQFGNAYRLYDQVGASLAADMVLRFTSWAHLQTSIAHQSSSYTHSDFGSNSGLDLSTGLLLTAGGSNALALKLDYSWRVFDQPALTDASASAMRGRRDPDGSEAFEITGITLRYSRPLGMRTGMKVSAGQRLLNVDQDYAVLGYTVDDLSPWAELWEGTSVSGSLKHYFPRQVITELSVAYYAKGFVDVLQLDAIADEASWWESRDDRLATVSLSASRPWSLRGGRLFTPTVSVGYRQNHSSVHLFDYDDLWTSLAVTMTI